MDDRLGKPSNKRRKTSMEISILGWLAGFLAGHFPEEEEKNLNFLLLLPYSVHNLVVSDP